MNKAIKTILAAAIGGAVPVALSSLQSCGSDPSTLITTCLAGAVVAVGALYTKPPGPTKKDDDVPPTDPGGN